MSKPAIDIAKLSQDERLALIEELWESLSEPERDAIPLAAGQQRELDRRLDALEREGPKGSVSRGDAHAPQAPLFVIKLIYRSEAVADVNPPSIGTRRRARVLATSSSTN